MFIVMIFLVTAMFNLNMVDTIGGGIRKLFHYQRERFFPLSEYELKDGRVKVTLSGKVLDIEFAQVLAENKQLSLEEIIMLDKIQKRKALLAAEEKHLKSKKLIEGRKPNFYFSATVAQLVHQKAKYSKVKGFDKKYYLDLIVKALQEHKSLDRSEIDELLWKKLADWMNEKQKNPRLITSLPN